MDSVNLHDLTQTIGDCGRFQGLLTLVIFTVIAVSVWGILIMSFGIFNPGWICLDMKYDDMMVTLNSSANESSPIFSEKSENLSDQQWSQDCTEKSSCTNFVYNKESSTIVSEWDLTCDRSWIPSMMISIQLTGMLVGGCMSGQIGDRFGRKLSIYLHLALHGIAHLVAPFSVSWRMYTSVLFFLGYTSGGLVANCFSFPYEFVKGWWRGIITSIPVWSIGFVIFSLIVWLLRDWKQIHFVGAAISAVVFLTVFWTPESIRWLTVRGKVDNAKKVVSRIARFNGQPFPNTQIIDKVAREERDRMGDHSYTYLDLFRISSLRPHSIKFGVIWIIIGLIYFTIIFVTRALSGNFYLNLTLSALIEIPVFFAIPPAVNNFGRRKSALIMFLAQTAGCFALAIVCLVVSATHTSVLVLALLCKMLIAGLWSIFVLFSAEVFPTVVRAMLFGYLNAIARVGAIISPFLIPDDSNKIYIPFLAMGIIGLVACGIIWSLPETQGMALKDTTRDAATKEDLILETNFTLEADEVFE